MPRATFLVFNGNNALLLPETKTEPVAPGDNTADKLNVKIWSPNARRVFLLRSKDESEFDPRPHNGIRFSSNISL